jgi:tetratricopeptide (TPR) repeat protein
MKRTLSLIVVAALVCAAAYLLNPEPVQVHFWRATVTPPAPLGIVLVAALLAGAGLVLLALWLYGAGRSIADWWTGRGDRRALRAERLEQHGNTLLWEGQSTQARALFLRAWRRDAGNRRALLAAVDSYLDDGEIRAAERLLNDALARHRGDPDLLFAVAAVCARQGDHAGAIRALEQVRARHPHAPRVLRALRDHYAATARWNEAASIQELSLRSLARSPQLVAERRHLLGLQYEAACALPAPAERVTALEPLANVHPPFVPALVSLGDALVGAGRASDALALWQRGLRAAPRTVFIERLLEHGGDPPQLQAWRAQFRKLRAPAARPEAVRFWQARAQLADGRSEELLSELDALGGTISARAIRVLRAQVLRQRGHVEQALSEYAQAANDATPPAYTCRGCTNQEPAWLGRCGQCGGWDSFRAAVEIAAD